jgi:hypothetical protein
MEIAMRAWRANESSHVARRGIRLTDKVVFMGVLHPHYFRPAFGLKHCFLSLTVP